MLNFDIRITLLKDKWYSDDNVCFLMNYALGNLILVLSKKNLSEIENRN